LVTGGGLMAISLALAFSKPWSRAAKAFIFASGVGLAFLAGCMRVVVMSYVVRDIAKFQFWHGTEGFLIFAAVTYSLFALSIFLAPRLFPSFPDSISPTSPPLSPISHLLSPHKSTSDPKPYSDSTSSVAPPLSPISHLLSSSQSTSDPKMGKVLAIGMSAVALLAWARLPWILGGHADFPYPDLGSTLQASAPELTPNTDPYAERSWGLVARYHIPQGELTLSYRPSGDFIAIRTIFRNLTDNTPTDWETVSVPEGSVAWRALDEKLELATLVHPRGQLTVSEEEFGQAIQKVRLDPANLARWFIGQSKLRERRAVLVHLQVAGVGADQVQSFVPVVVQAARLTDECF